MEPYVNGPFSLKGKLWSNPNSASTQPQLYSTELGLTQRGDTDTGLKLFVPPPLFDYFQKPYPLPSSSPDFHWDYAEDADLPILTFIPPAKMQLFFVTTPSQPQPEC